MSPVLPYTPLHCCKAPQEEWVAPRNLPKIKFHTLSRMSKRKKLKKHVQKRCKIRLQYIVKDTCVLPGQLWGTCGSATDDLEAAPLLFVLVGASIRSQEGFIAELLTAPIDSVQASIPRVIWSNLKKIVRQLSTMDLTPSWAMGDVPKLLAKFISKEQLSHGKAAGGDLSQGTLSLGLTST